MPVRAGADARSTIVVANALAAQQWEMHLAAASIAGAAAAWETPPIKSYAAWLDELWLEHGDERGPALTPNQSFALWRRVIAESAESGDLIGHAGAAEWAASAWALLHRWRIDPAEQRAAASQVDYRAFLGWCRAYRARLDANRWIDRAELETALSERAFSAGRLVMADAAETHPAREVLFARLAAQGAAIEEVAAPVTARTQQSARLADAADELRAALAWASVRLQANPAARIAVVVPTAQQRQDEIERAADVELPGDVQTCWTQGRTLASEPPIGAAFDALSLASAHASYAMFGRWLRSPFFAAAPAEQFARARLDAELRAELRSQLPFQAAYRCGLRELLNERAAESGRALEAALRLVSAARRATPGRWAHTFSLMLAALGWQPPSARPPMLGWQSALDELGRLTPIVGEITLDAALAELARLLERATPPALPLHGVHVLTSVHDVGPGYDGAWATGFTDSAWPEPPHGNPLLPLALQREHGLPYSSPRDATLRSERALERLVQRSPALVASWPARVFDYETEPSPAIRAWPALAGEALEALRTARALPTAARETVADAAPRFSGARIPGGTGALGRQARCPLRAFCQDRLGARPLEALAFGVPARLRGIATHHAAELLLEDQPAQAAFAGKLSAVQPSVERALARLFGRARRHLESLYALEAEQLERVLTGLLAAEQLRGPFRVRAVEQRAAVALGALTLNVRIDRIDELGDGSLAIIDYKTGERATSAAWFGTRLKDAQVPLYASESPEPVAAAVVARLAAAGTRYSGFWPDGAFPGRSTQGAHPDSAVQREIWREQLALLAAEFAAGDVRVFLADYEDAVGAYAPLTRVFEQLALARATAPRW